jgi:hypothetical protein
MYIAEKNAFLLLIEPVCGSLKRMHFYFKLIVGE